MFKRTLLVTVPALAFLVHPSLLQADPIAIAEVKRDGEVDFEKEILAILRRNCLACHNNTDAEGDLVLETPQTILKGGAEGPAVVAGKGLESLLLKSGAMQEDPAMPPEDNDVGAKPLTSEELGLIKLWIDQGAKGEVTGSGGPISWQPLPAGVNPIYSIAISPDGQYAAAGRANQIFLYHVPSKRAVGRLTDPALLETETYDKPGVAHMDLVQSLRFSPDSELLASGGYRNVKLWKRSRNAHKVDLAGVESPVKALAVSADGKWAAMGEESGKVRLYELPSGKLVRTLEAHAGAASGVAFSTDSTKLVSGGQDKKFKVWNVADGAVAGEVETPAPINAVAFVTDSTQIASGGADNIIRIWALPPGEAAAEPPKPVKELAGHGGPVTSLAALLPTGAQLLSGSQDGTARVWDVNAGNAVKNMNHGGPVTGVAVRLDGQRFASAGANNIAKLWAADGKQIAELKGDFRAKIKVEDVTRLVAIAKREIAATKADLKAATDRKAAEEKNATTAEEARKKADEEHKKKIEEAKKPATDKTVGEKAVADVKAGQTKSEADKKAAEAAVVKADEAIKKGQTDLAAADKRINDTVAAAKTVSDTLAESLKKVQEAAKAQPDNKALADLAAAVPTAIAGAGEGQKKVAEAAKVAAQKAITDGQAAKKTADETKKTADAALAKYVTDLKAAEENLKKLADAAQKAVDAQKAAERALQSATRTVGRAKEAVKKATGAIPPVEVTVKAAEEKTKKTEEQLTGVQQTATESEKPYHAIAFSADGLTLATGGDDQSVRTWDAETGAAVESFAGHGAAVTAVAYSAQGDVLSVAANKSAILWDTNPEWKLQRTIGSVDSVEHFVDRVTALDFSADGSVLATGGGEPSRSGELKLWKVADGSLVKEIKDAHSDVIYGLEFSPDGKQIASSASDRFAKIFEVESGKFVRSFEGHTHHVLGVSWRADGRLLATSGADNVIKIWDVRTGDQKRTIAGFGKEVTAIRFVADGSNVVASSGDKTVQIKNADNGGNVKSLGGAADFMYSVSASANGKVIVAGGQDSVVRIWKDDGNVLASFEAPTADAGAE
ncbi:MAG: hypothetical protein CMJ64_16515 [Planctomycetaceae bacterium]|nr:hypothetical protein [Planctomycetaceae bacterium]